MKLHTKHIFALVGILALGLTAARAQTDGALLDALVQKGVLSDQEAEDIRASSIKEYSQTGASKLTLSNHITNLKLYGDARYRFEYLDEKPQNSLLGQSSGSPAVALGNHATTTNRSRYRVRFGADYTFTDDFSAGIELESGTAADSSNQTIGNGYGKFGINVGLLYLQWKPTEWATLTGGKQRNPIYTTDLVWDPDINPEGGTEVLSWTIPIDFDDDAPSASSSSDPKALAPARSSGPSDYSLTVGITGGQFIYADNNENAGTPLNGTGVADKTDVWQFVEQIPVQFNFDKDTFIKEAPGFSVLTGGGNSNSGAGGWTNSSITFVGPHAADHLKIVTAPGEIDWKFENIPFKVYWDFALNLEGKARIQDVYLGEHNGLTTPGAATTTLNAGNLSAQRQNQGLGDNIAWVAGLQVGQNKKKGDWSIKGDFRQVGLGSIDPNTNDSDWGDSFLNQQGVKVQGIYNFTDFLTGSLTYINSWDLKTSLFDGTNGQSTSQLPLVTQASSTGAVAGLNGVKSTERIEADIIWKF